MLLALDDPVFADAGFPVTLSIEHPCSAAVQAAAFEQFWRTARPYRATSAPPARPPSKR